MNRKRKYQVRIQTSDTSFVHTAPLDEAELIFHLMDYFREAEIKRGHTIEVKRVK